MWFDPACSQPDWKQAARHLSRVDPVLAGVVKNVGPCGLVRRRDYFVVLCKSIFSQQISVKVAAVLFARFRDQFPGKRPTPARVVAFLEGDLDRVRQCGLSRQKAAYLRDLAQHFLDGRIPTRKLGTMPDEQVIEALVAVKGIGRWTAEMFLMFVLNRPDVLPVDDLGLREGVRELYALAARPTKAELTQLAEPWKPYRSVGTWYVWRRNSKIPLTTESTENTENVTEKKAKQKGVAGRANQSRNSL
jgi:DNA-3-methyladenine glycosylase II